MAATHGCDRAVMNEPPTILCILRSDFSPHVNSAMAVRKGLISAGASSRDVIVTRWCPTRLPVSTATGGFTVVEPGGEHENLRKCKSN